MPYMQVMSGGLQKAGHLQVALICGQGRRVTCNCGAASWAANTAAGNSPKWFFYQKSVMSAGLRMLRNLCRGALHVRLWPMRVTTMAIRGQIRVCSNFICSTKITMTLL